MIKDIHQIKDLLLIDWVWKDMNGNYIQIKKMDNVYLSAILYSFLANGELPVEKDPERCKLLLNLMKESKLRGITLHSTIQETVDRLLGEAGEESFT